jgi:hypothetical protein
VHSESVDTCFGLSKSSKLIGVMAIDEIVLNPKKFIKSPDSCDFSMAFKIQA